LRPFELDGRVAVVTGVLGRLGPVWARGLIEAGARVVGIDLSGAEPSRAFKELVTDCGGDELMVLEGDVCRRSSLEGALTTMRELAGQPDVLVNNAGIDQPPAVTTTARLEELSTDTLETVFGVNVLGAFLATQVFGGAMVAKRSGSIVNIGSLYASVSPDPRMYDHIPVDPPFLKPPSYGASKAALVNLSRYFATHWAPHGVRVNVLSPGGVAGNQDPIFVEKFSSRVPLGRLAMADDLVGPLVFLASDASSYVTGIELVVDGGYRAW
jgi:NAD(P)-dependent dehydrogenase (short-subunit alcohol dehydrogenase family)